MSTAARPERDACPGALRVHDAADGGLARVRVPGGALTPRQFAVLGAASAGLGDGGLELTSRANVQVRGLAAGRQRELADRLSGAGLLPSATHERVRNILGSPYDDDRALLDTQAVARALDEALCATPALADLPGRFLFAVDDGRGDVVSMGADVGLLALDAATVALVLGGVDSGIRSTPEGAPALALAAAVAFLAEKDGREWRVNELRDGVRRITERVRAATGVTLVEAVPVPSTPPGTHAQVGEVFRRGGAVAIAAGAPLGRLSWEQVDIITAASEAADGLRLTPWRTVVVTGLPAGDAPSWLSALDARGLVVDARAPGAGVTSCTGRPGCAKALADVRGDARRASPPPGGLPVHWSGCGRRCGRPQGRVLEVLATEAGYEVGLDDENRTTATDLDEVGAALDAARRAV
ncbi:precorrin-3B synthase [Saccharopolyspora erythraea NRRL 2338]|uniref:Cobalamin biosynthesis protein CobG,precorrin-3B synthase n=2 Tax=Saccharopolyspora erythraea TaxID=1836 RepID=A4FM61_SACEN|nr:precorrin-3B synthase [Saccharopolyspora erythraea]PFG98774.1 precorrin-3B synthase [Saccharopolyspora erythraea NRRL 2338]QRK88776.1 precorrin-3B synthase [Saccharopolyspora erythraea]CAM05136.1 cobalamin biosynthesis protein CobG,precorrin-3B synthase [Saccharopolyspora erythraea NRRL 2338]